MTATPYQLGGSDAAAICGVDPYRTPLDVYLELTDPRFQREPSEAMEWGTRLEPLIAEAVAERGYDVMPFPADGATDPGFPWLVGHPDGITVVRDEYAILECKTVNVWAHREWNGGIPLQYDAQVQLYMLLTGWPRALLAALVGGQKLELHTVERNEQAMETMLQLMVRFYAHLQTGIPPAPMAGDRDNLAILYPNGEGVGRYDKADMDVVYDLRLIREAQDNLKRQREEKENYLKDRHGDNATMLAPNDYEVSRWTTSSRTAFDTAAFKRDHPGLYAEYSKTTQLRRFQLL